MGRPIMYSTDVLVGEPREREADSRVLREQPEKLLRSTAQPEYRYVSPASERLDTIDGLPVRGRPASVRREDLPMRGRLAPNHREEYGDQARVVRPGAVEDRELA